ncbi:MAG TPA: hypothetical protein VGP12_02205 [Nitrosospira sp.]|nr:hypothetical protein [Nitrosospira sp.]
MTSLHKKGLHTIVYCVAHVFGHFVTYVSGIYTYEGGAIAGSADEVGLSMREAQNKPIGLPHDCAAKGAFQLGGHSLVICGLPHARAETLAFPFRRNI